MPGDLRWTEEQLREHMERMKGSNSRIDAIVGVPEARKRSTVPRGRQMNKTEGAYAQLLSTDPSVTEYRFESVTLLLADGCRYTPDFFVQLSNGELQFIEIKAGMRRKSGNVGPRVMDGAGEKFKWAREKYPMFRFRMVYLYKGCWTEV